MNSNSMDNKRLELIFKICSKYMSLKDVIVGGSYASGNEKSDLDLIIVTDKPNLSSCKGLQEELQEELDVDRVSLCCITPLQVKKQLYSGKVATMLSKLYVAHNDNLQTESAGSYTVSFMDGYKVSIDELKKITRKNVVEEIYRVEKDLFAGKIDQQHYINLLKQWIYQML